jgi:serine/threonine protein kinase
MGEVWKARDTRLNRVVAIKVSQAKFSERFEREARSATGTEVRNGSVPIDIVVSLKAGLVAGTVQNADAGKPAPGATVVMIPQEKERAPIPEYYQQGTTDQHGRFAFKSVAPGRYKVYAWEDVEPTAWMDAEFMKPFLAKGETVTVEESGRAEVEVSVIPANSEKEKR